VANKIIFVKVAGVLFVGKEVEQEVEAPVSENGIVGLSCYKGVTLKSPRMVFANSATQEISLSRCIGNPETLNIGVTPDFSYYSEDQEFDKFFLQETSSIPNLAIVKK
jgi:hypothetical protein